MRVIAGRFKGIKLATLKGMDVRPTSDRVKESLFSILRDEIIDSTFLDLCAGSGNMGIEALSRGAGNVTFIDQNPLSIRMVLRNIEKCGVKRDDPQVTILRMDALKGIAYFSKRGAKFDIIFIDPPYHSEILLKSLHCIYELELLCQDSIIIAEHYRAQHLPDEIYQLRLFRKKRYGDTMLSFYSP